MILVVVIWGWGYFSRQGGNEETILISTTEMIVVEIDPNKEWIEFGIKDRTLKYTVYVDEKFDQPNHFPNPTGELDLKGSRYYFVLKPNQKKQSASVVINRKPR